MFNTKKPKPTKISTSSAPTTLNRPITPIRTINNEQKSQSKAIISKECHIKGDISGDDDISIFGKVEGTISIKKNTVTIETSAKINANIFAKVVNVNGNVVGNIEAVEKIMVAGNGNVTGDMIATKVILQDGSYFKGNVSMIDNKPDQVQTQTQTVAEINNQKIY